MIEANLYLGYPLPGTDARTLFQEAMEEQFAKVNSFVGHDPDAVAIYQCPQGRYINDQLSKHDGATDKPG